MDASRRRFLGISGAALAGGSLAGPGLAHGRPARDERPTAAVTPVMEPPLPPLKPPRLFPGHTVGLISPARATFHSQDIEIVTEVLAAFGLKSTSAPNLMKRYGYVGGRDEERAADVNAMFADPEVKGLSRQRRDPSNCQNGNGE